jgi:2-polyprenyl-3-methyl-5-hydroxy-6-metoxy-1,4-benzoquinol methylase
VSRTNGHAEVLALLGELGPGGSGRRLLDIPSGGGPVVAGARAAGFEVVEVDLFPRPRMQGVCADACAPLPFHDGSFDVVLSMEGIEHFENQAGFVRECARVLKPGGRLVLTTPNVLTLSGRAAAFLTGGRVRAHGFVNEATTLYARTGTRLYHGHAFLIDAFRLRYILRTAGLELRELRGTTVSSGSVLLAPLVPLVYLANRVAAARLRRRMMREGRAVPGRRLDLELRRLADSRALLFRRKLIFIAWKPPADHAPSAASAPGAPRATERSN